jgi:Ca-activated chloride channel family protein
MLTSLLPFLLCTMGWWPQQDLATGASRDSGNLIISTDVELVILDVGVKDAQGGYVSGLTAEDFRIYEDKKPQQIKYFSRSDIPVTIGLVIDNSGSMRSKRPGVITAALALVGASNPRDEIFVVNFNDRVRRGLASDVLFSDNIQTLRNALWIGNSEGRTKLYDALGYSLQYLNKGRMDKKTLVVVSDGGDNASILSRKEIMQRVQESRATIYSIDIFDENDPDSNSDVLKKLAQVSGGEYFQLREIPEIVTVCTQIAKDIRNRYTIAYIPSHLGSPRSMHLIKVTASAPSREKLLVRTRSRYMMPERNQATLGLKETGQ